MGTVHLGAPRELILHLQRTGDIQTFVETGTYLGTTSAWAAAHFAQVITVENARALYDKAMAVHGMTPNIDFRFGHSLDVLREIVPALTAPALFWLDDHWSGGETYGEHDECPILGEIAILNAAPINHYVLIDDARLFTAPPPAPMDLDAWPPIDQVIEQLKAGPHAKYVVIFEDAVIAVPQDAKTTLAPWLRDTITRQMHEANTRKRRPALQRGLEQIGAGVKILRTAAIGKARYLLQRA